MLETADAGREELWAWQRARQGLGRCHLPVPGFPVPLADSLRGEDFGCASLKEFWSPGGLWPGRHGRVPCVAGQGSVSVEGCPSAWGRWGLAPMGFLTPPGRFRSPQPALDC